MNDLNSAMKHCKVHIILLMTQISYIHLNDSMKKLNKAVNSDLKHLTNWLNANKISLNVDSKIIL